MDSSVVSIHIVHDTITSADHSYLQCVLAAITQVITGVITVCVCLTVPLISLTNLLVIFEQPGKHDLLHDL